MKTFATCIALCTLTLAAPALVRADGDKPAPKKEAKKGKADKKGDAKDAPQKDAPKKDAPAPAGGGW